MVFMRIFVAKKNEDEVIESMEAYLLSSMWFSDYRFFLLLQYNNWKTLTKPKLKIGLTEGMRDWKCIARCKYIDRKKIKQVLQIFSVSDIELTSMIRITATTKDL